jgi:hypothetical protein
MDANWTIKKTGDYNPPPVEGVYELTVHALTGAVSHEIAARGGIGGGEISRGELVARAIAALNTLAPQNMLGREERCDSMKVVLYTGDRYQIEFLSSSGGVSGKSQEALVKEGLERLAGF